MNPTKWWKTDPELDLRIRQAFLKLWAEKRQLPAETFLSDPLTALAAVILFDQFPRNMFRGHADQFATDHLALAVAQEAVERGFDDQLIETSAASSTCRSSTARTSRDQKRSVLLFSRLGSDFYLGYAKKHLEIIERFGRFPHRNALLGRAPRPDEIAAGGTVPW